MDQELARTMPARLREGLCSGGRHMFPHLRRHAAHHDLRGFELGAWRGEAGMRLF
jgi:hypothetical protein